jgi:hypothetical protein
MLTPLKRTGKVFAAIMFVCALVLTSAASAATMDDPQPNQNNFRFDDQELLNFFDVNRDLSELNKELQEKMTEAAMEYNLSLERFNQIAAAAQIGALQGGAFTDDEVQAFNNLGPRISQIQREHQQRIQSTLEENGFTTARYQEILNQYRTDQNLQAHVRDLLRERRRQEILEERKRAAEESAGKN